MNAAQKTALAMALGSTLGLVWLARLYHQANGPDPLPLAFLLAAAGLGGLIYLLLDVWEA